VRWSPVKQPRSPHTPSSPPRRCGHSRAWQETNPPGSSEVSEQHLGEGVECGRAHRELGSGVLAKADAGRATGWLPKSGRYRRPLGSSQYPAARSTRLAGDDPRGKNGGARRHQDRPGGSLGARVPQDIDSEVVSGQATAIPAPPAASRPGLRKQKAGAVPGPADGIASSFGALVPYGTRVPPRVPQREVR